MTTAAEAKKAFEKAQAPRRKSDMAATDVSIDTIITALETMAEYGEPPQSIVSLLDVGSDQYLQFFVEEICDRLIAGGGSTCRFFEGPYGAGKTHLLKLLEERALQSGFAVVRTDLSSDLHLEDWAAITRYILRQIQANIGGEQVRSLFNILTALGRQGAMGSTQLKTTPMPHPGFRNAIFQALHLNQDNAAKANLLRSYLHGDKVTSAELKRADILGVKNSLNERNAEAFIKTLTESLNILGLSGFMLLFDENEKSFQPKSGKPSQKQLNAANLMRHLVDGCIIGTMPRTIVVFTILPGFLETMTIHYQALGQRLAMVRDMDINGSWRWPVLSLEQVNTAAEAELFLQQAIARLCEVVSQCGLATDGLAPTMHQWGSRILEQNAGAGYKRDLMKRLAGLAIEQIRGKTR